MILYITYTTMKLTNKYFILRHGQAFSNKDRFVSSWPEKRKNPLTEKGEKQIQRIGPKLKKENIELIFSSDLLRTKLTAQMVADVLDLDVNFDKRLREYDTGAFNDKSIEQWNKYFKNQAEKFIKRPEEGENRRDIRKRLTNFITEIEKQYDHKNILIISHEDPLIILQAIIKGLSEKELIRNWEKFRINPGEYRGL